MTQYWLAGRKLATTPSVKSSYAQLPVAVDLVTHPQLHPEPLMKDDLDLLKIVNKTSKWLLIELETINQTINSKMSELTKKSDTDKEQSGSSNQEKDDTELVINLYTQSTIVENVNEKQSAQNGQSNTSTNTTTVLHCPIGTFDCTGDGMQCIPSGLRYILLSSLLFPKLILYFFLDVTGKIIVAINLMNYSTVAPSTCTTSLAPMDTTRNLIWSRKVFGLQFAYLFCYS